MQVFRLHNRLSLTQRAIINSVQAFCKTELRPRVYNDFRKESTDREIFQKFGEVGLFGPTIRGYNCLAESYTTYGLIAKEIESVDSGYRSMYSVQSSLVMRPIDLFGSSALKSQYLYKLASGEWIGCFGLTEPDAGSDPNAMQTRAVRIGDSYVLNGSKTWISNAPIADVFVIWAKDEKEVVRGFVMDRDTKGLSTSAIDGKMSLRTSVTGSIFLDDVRVPDTHVLDVKGLKGPFQCLNAARLGIAFGVLGAAENCMETTIQYALQRSVFGEKLASKQLFQHKMADMVSEYNLALLGCLHVAKHMDDGTMTPEMISLVKRNSCHKALVIARTCREIFGANGISEHYDVFRHMCNLETVSTYEGTHDIHSLILGAHVTNHRAF
jgi:glutaryl-CoA dehydrogenase